MEVRGLDADEEQRARAGAARVADLEVERRADHGILDGGEARDPVLARPARAVVGPERGAQEQDVDATEQGTGLDEVVVAGQEVDDAVTNYVVEIANRTTVIPQITSQFAHRSGTRSPVVMPYITGSLATFQMLFFSFAMVGAAVFILLDAPPLRTMSGGKSVVALVAFYILLCTVCIAGASFFPQFDPEDEKGKIARILKPQIEASEKGKTEELIARAKALDDQVKALEIKLKALGGDQAVKEQPSGTSTAATTAATTAVAGDFMKLGEEQWQLQECYNCHKLKGEGGKKRGPELDNIGTLLTVTEIRQKIEDPKSFMAEGFEKEWEKGMMPTKFKDLMEPNDILALASWLGTFKNTSVNTPRPIKKK